MSQQVQLTIQEVEVELGVTVSEVVLSLENRFTVLASDMSSGLAEANQVPTADGAGGVSWEDQQGGGGGGVTAVSGTAPIASTGGTTPVISITPATVAAAGSMSAADKTKLNGIAVGADVTGANAPKAHAASHITGGGDVVANAVADGAAGLMTGADKTKLDGIAAGAEVNAVETAAEPLEIDSSGELSLPPAAPATQDGYMSKEDKTKLDGIDAGADVTADNAPKAHATSHVTGGGDVVASAVAGGNAGLMTGADKTKLDGIDVGAEVNNIQIVVEPLDLSSAGELSLPAAAANVQDGYLSKEDKDKINNLAAMANVADAPADGNTYGRKNNAWEATSGSGLIESVAEPLDVDSSGELSLPPAAPATQDGYMSKEDKTKLDGIDAGAEVNAIISAATPLAIDVSRQISFNLPIGYGGGAVVSNFAILNGTALAANTTGAENFAAGVSALAGNTTGSRNVAIGFEALKANIGGTDNIAIGYQTLTANTTGYDNVAIGYRALSANTIGIGNVALGNNALSTNGTGSNNVAIGYQVLNVNTTGAGNVAIGNNSLGANTIGANNVAVGYQALDANTTGDENIAIGTGSLGANTIGENNIAIGFSALLVNTTGVRNIAIGTYVLDANTTGTDNIGIGHEALSGNTGGIYNIAIGRSALKANTIANGNIAVGYASMVANTTGANNTAVGYASLTANTIGLNNTAYGYNALAANTTGGYNTAVGRDALKAHTTGEKNTAVGAYALDSVTIGMDNTGIGYDALSGVTTGTENTALGESAGNSITVGTNCTCIGFNSDALNVNSTNEITLGDSRITSLRCATTTISTLSDERDKADIQDFNVGLDFIGRIVPRQWAWDKRDWYKEKVTDEEGNVTVKELPRDGSKKIISTRIEHGFIAQELDRVQQETGIDIGLVTKLNLDRLEATPGKLLTVLVVAVKELAAKVKALEAIKA